MRGPGWNAATEATSMIRPWRLAALLASKNGDFFKALSTDADQAEVLAAAVGPMQATAELLRGMAETMDCVASRVMVAGCNHVEFDSWMLKPVAAEA